MYHLHHISDTFWILNNDCGQRAQQGATNANVNRQNAPTLQDQHAPVPKT